MRYVAPYIFGIAFAWILAHAVVSYTNKLLAIGTGEVIAASVR